MIRYFNTEGSCRPNEHYMVQLDDPLWDVPNLLLTPHVAGGMRLEITRRKCVEMAQENLRRYLAGEKLENLVR